MTIHGYKLLVATHGGDVVGSINLEGYDFAKTLAIHDLVESIKDILDSQPQNKTPHNPTKAKS